MTSAILHQDNALLAGADPASDSWTEVAALWSWTGWSTALLTAASPCFFWDEINLVADLSGEEIANMLLTVRKIRQNAIRLLMTYCVTSQVF